MSISTLGMRIPFATQAGLRTRRLTVRANYVPDYSSPDPSQYRGPGRDLDDSPSRVPIKKFWDYQAPSASIGSPDGYQLQPVTIPEYGVPDSGSGGGWFGGWGGGGSGGGGGGGGGGDPMKGFTYLFALILFGAGLSAYVKKGSSTSLIISSGVALLLLISASLMGNPSSRIGSILALATCIALSGIMGVRAKKSGKLVPAGLVSILSVLMSGGYVATLV